MPGDADVCLSFVRKERQKNQLKFAQKLQQADNFKRARLSAQDQGSYIQALQSNAALPGDVVLRDLRDAILLRRELNQNQRIIIEIFVQANLPNIYKEEFTSNEIRIKLENYLEQIKTFVFLCCPRRWGKTFITAWFVACSLVCMVDITLIIFSPSMRQCQLFMKYVKKGLDLLLMRGYRFELPVNNAQELTLLREGRAVGNNVRVVPPKEDTVRGVSANIVIAEEASSLTNHFVVNVIGPLLGVNNTSLIAISTVRDSDNYYTKLLSSPKIADKHSGFSIYKFYAACKRCRESGIARTCKHLDSEKPSWMSSSRAEQVRLLYEVLDAEETFDQEIGGISRSVHKEAFNAEMVRFAFSESCVYPIGPPLFFTNPLMIYSCIDPTGGGGSDLAIVTMVYEKGIMNIIGLESISARDDKECFPQIIRHYQEIKKIDRLRLAHVYIWVEANMVWPARQIMTAILDAKRMGKVKDVHIMDNMGLDVSAIQLGSMEKVTNRTMTTHQVKQEMWMLFNDHLNSKRIGFLNSIVTVHHPSLDTTKMSARDVVRDMLLTQLLSYAIQVKQSTDPAFSADKVTFSGKSAAGAGRKDDLAVTAQLVLYWAHIRIANPNLKTYRETI